VETIVKRAAGLDVHKAQVTACVRVPGRGGGRAQELAEFSATVPGLLALRDWLMVHQVRQVAMEATGVYWKPVWAIVEHDFGLPARQRPTREAGPRSQDRRLRRRLAVPAARGRIARA
jgi:transposase